MYQAVYDAQFQNYIDVIKEGESDFIIPLQETYNRMKRFLLYYRKYSLRKFNSEPMVPNSIKADGSGAFVAHWDNKKFCLLITFPEKKKLITYYGESKDKESTRGGEFKKKDEGLFWWINQNRGKL
jgi:hypothetical protein